MPTAVYFMLRDGVAYRDLGPAHFDQRQRDSTIRRLIVRLNDLGYQLPVPLGPNELNAGIASAS
ncbi:MAG: hypothetical protein U1E40_07340 [Amaricoccus sp.]